MGEELYQQAQQYIRRDQWDLAVPLLRQAVEQGHPGAMADLCHGYCNGLGGLERNYEESCRLAFKAARKGHAMGWYNAAVHEEYGMGTPRNWVLAKEYYVKAGDLGYLRGYIARGRFDEKGKGVPKNLLEAKKWYRKACVDGVVGIADLNRLESRMKDPMMEYYYSAKDLQEEGRQEEALRMLEKAAVLGMSSAQVELGIALLTGNGLERDDVMGAAWLKRAAEQGDPDGQGRLGLCYLAGTGVPQDDARAFEMFSEAAQIPTKIGAFYLAKCYEEGIGTPRDLRKALELYREALKMRMPGSQERVDRLERILR